jgi:hypothetical protein
MSKPCTIVKQIHKILLSFLVLKIAFSGCKQARWVITPGVTWEIPGQGHCLNLFCYFSADLSSF